MHTALHFQSSKQWQEITSCFIAKEMMPVNVVEWPRFKEMIQKLDPCYKISSSLFTATSRRYQS